MTDFTLRECFSFENLDKTYRFDLIVKGIPYKYMFFYGSNELYHPANIDKEGLISLKSLIDEALEYMEKDEVEND